MPLLKNEREVKADKVSKSYHFKINFYRVTICRRDQQYMIRIIKIKIKF